MNTFNMIVTYDEYNYTQSAGMFFSRPQIISNFSKFACLTIFSDSWVSYTYVCIYIYIYVYLYIYICIYIHIPSLAQCKLLYLLWVSFYTCLVSFRVFSYI